MSHTTTYTVSGMTCEHCVASVTEEVGELPGVEDVAVDLASGRLTVIADREVEDSVVQSAVNDAGYELA